MPFYHRPPTDRGPLRPRSPMAPGQAAATPTPAELVDDGVADTGGLGQLSGRGGGGRLTGSHGGAGAQGAAVGGRAVVEGH